jgi:hypothetical protein
MHLLRSLQELDGSENVVNEVLDLDRVALSQEYGSVCGSVQTLKHLAVFKPKFPMYEGDSGKGEFFKKRGAADTIETSAARRNICLP